MEHQTFKVYVMSGAEVFFGYYPVVEHEVALAGEHTKKWDPWRRSATPAAR